MPLLSDQDSTAAGNISEREVRAQLDRILQSGTFKNSERLQRFLKFAVECVLDSTTDQLKESVLGRVVFDWRSGFDARTDSIVRVGAERLRKRVRQYYEIEGRGDPVTIDFQPGSYVAVSMHTEEQQGPFGTSDAPSVEFAQVVRPPGPSL